VTNPLDELTFDSSASSLLGDVVMHSPTKLHSWPAV